MKSGKIVGLISVAAVGLIGSLTSSAHAWWERSYVGGGVGCYYSCSEQKIAINDTSANPKYNLQTLNVEFFRNGTGTVSGKVCRQIWSGSGISCSATTTSPSGSGHYSLQLASRLGTWTSANFADFGYVNATTNISTTDGGASINGVFIHD